jgi:hypothetical protein
MAMAVLTEGTELICVSPDTIRNFPLATGWSTQQQAPNAVVKSQRVMFPGQPGVVGAAKVTVAVPATSISGLDRLQLYQVVRAAELFDSGVFEDRQSAPLHFHFQVYSNIDFQISVCINNAEAVRNFTINQPVIANRWNTIDVEIPPDTGPGWSRDNAFGCFFQIGLCCGDVRVAPRTMSGRWNDGHWLMIDDPTNAKFLMTEGAFAIIGDPSLSVAPYEPDFEPAAVARLRGLAIEEKSYRDGVLAGTPDMFPGALRFVATDRALDVAFFGEKIVPPVVHVYSPTTGAVGKVYDATAGRDVPASARAHDERKFHVEIPGAVIGNEYRFQWEAAALIDWTPAPGRATP